MWDMTSNPTNYGDWDTEYTTDDSWQSYVELDSVNPYEGTYSYRQPCYATSGVCNATTANKCTDTTPGGIHTVWFTGTVKFDATGGPITIGLPFWKAGYCRGAVGSSNYVLMLFVDETDSNKVKLRCAAGMYALCEALETWTCYNSSIVLDTWYEYALYIDLPFNDPNGRVDCWWNGVRTVNDLNVQTRTSAYWYQGYNTMYVGPVDASYWSGSGFIAHTDAAQDCACKYVGNVTATPPP